MTMPWPWPLRVRLLVHICLCFVPVAVAAAVKPVVVCPKGFYQEEVIVLNCTGGRGRQSMILSSEGPGHFGHFGWEVPKDTVDLSIEVLCEPLKSLHGSAELSAKCAGHNGEVILGKSEGLLNESTKRMVKAHGATWSWSGDVPKKHSGPFSLWLRVNGRLHCDLEFLVRNDQDSNLAVDVRYKWSQIKPCPKQLKGCSRCPTDKCHQEDVAVCDGSPYWECLPKEAIANSTFPVGHLQTAQRTTATLTVTTTSTALSLDDLMKEPQVQSLLREEEKVNSPKLPFGPLPTSHPAIAATDWRNSGHQNVTSSSRQGTPGVPWVWGYAMAGLALCSGCLAALCISTSSSRPSEQVRGQLGSAIQGQRTPYAPIDGDGP